MKQKRILVPTSGPESWKCLLSEPEKHWRPGFSAMSTALSWERANGIPDEIASLFRNAIDPSLRDAELNIAIPEYKVGLAGGSRPSQNDVFALLTCTGGLIAIMVEGKAREHFDETLLNWKKRTSPKGAEARLADIADHIGLTMQIPEHIRYQLLHRTASAVIEANRFHAPHTAMVVQSFVADDSENHYNDFCEFIELYGKAAVKNQLIELTTVRTCRLFAGWVYSSS